MDIPRVAAPVACVGPVHSLVAKHEAVNRVARIQDGARGPHLCMPDGIPDVVIAFEDLSVVSQNLQSLLQGPQLHV